jgi:eukaryotic-like serine/threonine-protein kinase
MNGKSLGTGSFLGNRYILEEEIGRGSMGAVFKARDLHREAAHDAETRVAIKVLNQEFQSHPNAVRALVREARKAQGLTHPNIVKVYDVVRDESNVCIVMELLEGESLDRVIKRTAGAGMGFESALKIIRDVCQALSHAHGRSILHTGFKPENVFLTQRGVVKVLDFGMARAVSRGDWASTLLTLFDAEALNTLTPAYAGCEVSEGKEPHVKDDIYAIACVFYLLLTGKHPFRGVSAEQASKADLRPARPSMFSRAQWRVLRNALEFRRDRRPTSVSQFANSLVPKRSSPAADFGWSFAATVAIGSIALAVYVTYRTPVATAAPASETPVQIESAQRPQLQKPSSPVVSSLASLNGARNSAMPFLRQQAR